MKTSLLSLAAIAVPLAFGSPLRQPKVLILGGGVSGTIAARTFHEQELDNFLIIEARDELGGRLRSSPFAGLTVELGANWVQGTQVGDGPANPIYDLAKKHNITTQYNDITNSITTFDVNGQVDYLDSVNEALDAYTKLTVAGGYRVDRSLVDATAKTGYSVLGYLPLTPQGLASEYYHFDWEYAQKPDQTSWIASSWANNFTFDVDEGGFSDEDHMAIDQRGFKALIQEESQEFLKPEQVLFNATVATISHSRDGVAVTLTDGRIIEGDFLLCTFSLGVLQNDDVAFDPPLPAWKIEAVQSMTMATYTKIFLQFPEKFWFDTEMALYADPERGRYPVWQSLDHPNFLPGSGIIFVTVTGDFSQRVEALSDEKVKFEVLEVLQTMYPDVEIPTPTDFLFYRWRADPLFRGSYSNWPPSFFSEVHQNLRASVGRVYFAGEATSQRYFGFLHGAYDEGFKVAQSMVNCIHFWDCSGLGHVEEVKSPHVYAI